MDQGFTEWFRDLANIDRWASQVEIVVLVAIAAALGGLIGWEREIARKPAGLRTHMFVAGAAAFLTLLGHVVVEQFLASTASVSNAVDTDPIRVIQAIIIGISFLGGGTIIQRGQRHVEGLTTAASLFLVATIGIAVALGELIAASLLTVLTVLVLYAVGALERWTGKKTRHDQVKEELREEIEEEGRSRK